jgi:hypothetical protein
MSSGSASDRAGGDRAPASEAKMPVAREPIVVAEMVDEVAREYAPAAEEAGRRLPVAVPTELRSCSASW